MDTKKRNLLSCFFLVAGMSLVGFSCESPAPEFDAYKQLSKDIQAIDDYLAGVGISAYKDGSGIRFGINQIGNGSLPATRTQSAKITYTVRLFDGTIVEETKTLEDDLNQFPTLGLLEGVELLPAGTKATLYVPSGLAYGNNSVGLIPPNTNLIYEVEALKVIPKPSEVAQLGADSVAIDTYLANNSIDAIKSELGIRYVVQEQGTGLYPTLYDRIRVSYSAKVMSTGVQFFAGTLEPTSTFDSRVVDYLPGLQIALRLLPVGSKATFYLPSTLAFGVSGAGGGTVPANANLIYQINSVEIVN
jgi:FKBP-type peptidyl-prolyl cis-trans isomerase FkpA